MKTNQFKKLWFRLTILISAAVTLTHCQTTSVAKVSGESEGRRCYASDSSDLGQDSNTQKDNKECVKTLSEAGSGAGSDTDNFYLEEVRGEKALQWVDLHNKGSLPKFENDPSYSELKSKILKILDDPNKLINVGFSGDYAYNFWQDAKNIRGVWRRTPIADYLRGERNWQVLLDIDELAKKENKNWVYAQASIFKEHALISLSDGGKDAHVVREFDLISKSFLVDGFILPEGKHRTTWINENELFLGLALGENELTDSGYPRQLRIWRRGERPAAAKVVFSGDKKDVSIEGSVTRDEEYGPARYRLASRALDFFS